jgi:serpin B
VITKALFVLMLGVGLAGCSFFPGANSASRLFSNRSRITTPPADPADMLQMAQANTRFGVDLYQALREQNDQNLFFSPYSISLALAMAEAGARGETRAEMDSVLHFDLPQERLHPAMNALDLALRAAPPAQMDPEEKDKVFQLSIANSVWGQKDYAFEPAYLDVLAEQYGAGLRIADFRKDAEGAREQINAWVSEETRQKIQELIPAGALDEASRLVLANAIYFKAGWQETFDPDSTGPAQFTLLDTSTKDIWMMAQSGYFPYASGDGWQALELPYVGQTAGMVVILPAPGRFRAFEQGLDATLLESITRQMEVTDAVVYLPRFKFDSSFELANVLQSLGMKRAFNFGQADFSGMAATNELYISRVIHKATVDVDEAGTEAAAATAVIATAGAAPNAPEPVTFRADRPFLFLIRDRQTNTLLFLGRVMEPVE